MPKNKTDIAKELGHMMLELRISIRQFLQQKFKENNIDLTYEMVQVMGFLWEKDGVNQQEIANLTFKDKASMTYLIDNLTKRDMVRRTEDENDRRNKLIHLTVQGKELKKLIQPWVTELYGMLSNDLAVGEMNEAIRILTKMNDNLKG